VSDVAYPGNRRDDCNAEWPQRRVAECRRQVQRLPGKQKLSQMVGVLIYPDYFYVFLGDVHISGLFNNVVQHGSTIISNSQFHHK
jgi:hypothetical protein